MSDIYLEFIWFRILCLITDELLWRVIWLCLVISKWRLTKVTKSVKEKLCQKTTNLYRHVVPLLMIPEDSWMQVHFVNKRFSSTVCNIDKDDRMKHETERYATFRKFPNDSPMWATHLAKNGFFYSGYKDLVKCFSCGAEHGKWKENDNPASLHAQISPHCRFVQGCSPNVPIDVEINSQTNDGIPAVKVKNARYSTTISSATNGEKPVRRTQGSVSAQTVPDNKRVASGNGTVDTTKSFGNNKYTDNCFAQSKDPKTSKCKENHTDNKPNITKVNQKATCRKYGFEGAAGNMPPKSKEKYISLKGRLNTFSNWPRRKIIEPGLLASAGFYYTGKSDIVVCFACGVKLCNWEQGDDPYIQHARWNPNCPNILDKKGHAFIKKHQIARPKTCQENTMKRDFTSVIQEHRQCLVGNGDNGIRRGEDSPNAQNGTSEGSERVLCKLCSSAKRNILFIPCRHVVVCETCACIVPKCLACNAEISDTKKIFIH